MTGLRTSRPFHLSGLLGWVLSLSVAGGAPQPAAEAGPGLAAKYPGDKGIAKDPAVIAFTDFESEAWREQWSTRDKPELVGRVTEDAARKFQPLAGAALRVKVAAGGHMGASLTYPFRRKVGQGFVGEEPEEIYFRYYLRLGDDWDPADGGKLPGIAGTYGKGGWGGRKADGRNGWSARGSFRRTSGGLTAIGFYCYHADQRGAYGSGWLWDRDRLGYLANNRWYCIEQHARMNTPGKNDGVLRAWIDGKPAFEKTDIRMRDVDRLKIECIWVNIYHGGKRPARTDDHLYIDNAVIARKYIGPLAAARPPAAAPVKAEETPATETRRRREENQAETENRSRRLK